MTTQLEATLAARLRHIAMFAESANVRWLRETAERNGWRGLDDDDFAYAADLLDCGHSPAIALERLYLLVTDEWVYDGDPVERWRCCACEELHENEIDAEHCCPPQVEQVFLCGRCGKSHWHEDRARSCCETVLRAGAAA